MRDNEPFHDGELAAQERTGAGDMVSIGRQIIRPFMPEQHRDFYTALPFLVLAAPDQEGRPWVTILDGDLGFVTSPDTQTLALNTRPHPSDPLAAAFANGAEIGLLGIELATRRRNRLSGVIHPDHQGLAIDIRQSFGNCPQYIREREWHRVEGNRPGNATSSTQLSDAQRAWIGKADTMFIGTGYQADHEAASNGYDASHRGGEPGFVQIVDDTHLRIPDYAGNNAFNSIGNLLKNPRIGLLFIDFETGDMLHLSGNATIDWDAASSDDPAARRTIDVTIDAVIERPSALSIRWQSEAAHKRPLVVAHKVVESSEITSLYLKPADGLPLDGFEPGQHLPIELNVPGNHRKVFRSYSLSGHPTGEVYRLSVKREEMGLASRHIHDALKVGDVIGAGRPSGDFVIPCSACPLVLVSAGVGITPMLAMLHATAREDDGQRPVWFVHGARNGEHHALREEVDHLVDRSANARRIVHYSQPQDSDIEGQDYDATGRISPESLIALNAGPDARYMLCGPAAFISAIQSGLKAGGVPEDQIHFETFGPVGA